MLRKQKELKRMLLTLLFVIASCSALVLISCTSQKTGESTKTNVNSDANKADANKKDIDSKIVGMWMTADINGKPALTNEKDVFKFITPNKVYMSVSKSKRPGWNALWLDTAEADVKIDGNELVITEHVDEKTVRVLKFDITAINDNEFAAVRKPIRRDDNPVMNSGEDVIRYTRVNVDFEKSIIGTWEGKCTSKGSVFDDDKEHRWKYNADGTYVYYIKEGDNWVPSKNTVNEYFVEGNLLCTRWNDKDVEYREWWEINIDNNKMNWVAQRDDDDGKVFTATFEMKKVEE